jgi:periplasmic protein CpxP/Spy
MFQNKNIGAFSIVGLILLNTVLLVLLLKKPDVPAVINNQSDHGPVMGPDKEGPRRWMEEQMGFTPEQVKQFGMLIEEHRYSMFALRDSIASKREELSKLLMSDSVSSGTADAITVQIGNLQAELEKVNYKHFADVREMCTPEQKPKFDSIIIEVAGAIGHGPPPPGEHGHHPSY